MKRCDHGSCDFENRWEYCETQAADRDGAAAVVAEMLDALLYESGPVSSDTYTLRAEQTGQTLNRSFSYLRGDPKSWVWPLTETTLAIRHIKDKSLVRETYEVAVAWHVEQSGATEDRFITTYGIDIYPQGDIQAFIEQPSVLTDALETRRMTPYDYEILYDELAVVYGLHAAERADNARILQ